MRDLTIAQLARTAGVGVDTVRFYERVGLLPPAARTAAGHRRYDGAGVERLSSIRRARALGFTLDETRILLAMPGGVAGCGGAKAVASARAADLRAEIARLERSLGTLEDTVARCGPHGGSPCPVLDLIGRNGTPAAGD